MHTQFGRCDNTDVKLCRSLKNETLRYIYDMNITATELITEYVPLTETYLTSKVKGISFNKGVEAIKTEIWHSLQIKVCTDIWTRPVKDKKSCPDLNKTAERLEEFSMHKLYAVLKISLLSR